MSSTNGTEVTDLVPMPMVIATMALSVIGLIGNSLVVLATLISPSLRSRCNYLICILAICDVCVCIYLIELRILMLQKWYFRSNINCFTYSILGLFALNVQSGMGLILGVDRLLAVSLPMRYSHLPKSLYISMMAAVVTVAAGLTLYGYFDSSSVSKVPVCLPPTAYNDSSRTVWIISNLAISILVITVYTTAHMKCRHLNATTTHEQTMVRIQRLLNSLTIVVAVYSMSWFLTIVALLVTQLCPLPSYVVNQINQQLAWLVIINASGNFFIYFWRAPEYRKAFLYLLHLANSDERGISEVPSRNFRTQTTVVQKEFFMKY